MLGYCYHYGKGVSIDMKKAIQFYYQAAELGNSLEQNNLGICFENGDGVSKDFRKAIDFYSQWLNWEIHLQCLI
jgi:TPR repeat protein